MRAPSHEDLFEEAQKARLLLVGMKTSRGTKTKEPSHGAATKNAGISLQEFEDYLSKYDV